MVAIIAHFQEEPLNVFGRTPDAGGLQNWINQIANPAVSGITRGSVMQEMLLSAAAPGNSDGVRLANQADFGVQSILDGVPTATATAQLANITSDDATVTAATTAVSGEAGNVLGQTIAMVKGLDNVIGTENNDLILGSVDSTAGSELQTFSAIDVINGNGGIDTLKISAATALTTANLANISNIEVITLDAASTVGGATGVANAFDTSAITGLTKLDVTKGTTLNLKAAATTDINATGSGFIEVYNGKDVSVTNATTNQYITVGNGTAKEGNATGTITVTDTDNSGATNNITVYGGTDVTVTATSKAVTGNIIVGDATKGTATGNVVVTQNLNDVGAAGLNNAALPITVTGGKTVNVTVNGTSTADASGDSGVLALSAIKVVGDGKTTDVTATQTKTVNLFTDTKVDQVDAKSVVTFVAMAKDESTTVNGLTFTASKALTAAEVASAFANLILADAQTPSGPTANGYFTGTSSTKAWTSGAASGATVTFTNADATQVAAATTTHNLVVTDTAAAGNVAAVTTAGTAATGTTGGAASTGGSFSTNSVSYGTVSVDDNATASIKTVTLNGFASADLGLTGTDLNALTTLNIANNTKDGDVALASTSTTLALNVNNITSDATTIASNINVGDSVNNLTIGATGADSTFILGASALKDLTINAAVALDISTTSTGYATTNLKTVDVNGAGAVNLGILTTAALNSFDASGNTGGVTATIDTATASVGTITNYIFSEGNDVVTLDETAVNTKITLGAGDDKINLKATTTALANTIDGGTGTNTIHMNSADANKATGATSSIAFESKISNFQKLSLANVLTGAQDTIDLANMDDISYVVSAGAANVKEAVDITITAGTNTAAGDTASITINGKTFTSAALGAADSVTAIATALVDVINNDTKYTASTNTAGVINIVTTAPAMNGVLLDISAISITGTGTVTSANTVTSSLLTLENMANNGTLELTAAGTGTVVTMTDATGLTDTFNILIGDNAGNVGTVNVNGVETVKVTTTNTFVDTTGGLNGNNVAVADGIDETPSAATLLVSSDKTTTVDVSGAGALSLTTASSVLTTVNATSMTGALTYTASVNSVVVTGGTVADILTANADDVRLNGANGNDILTVNAGADRVILDGGAGADTFVIAGAASTSSTYANILNVGTGDIIDFTGATSFAATKVTLSAGATETTQALMDLAINNLALNQMGWFQTGGNTFIVMDASSNGITGFDDNSDMVVMITGLVDLSTASFNVAGTLEIA